MKTNVAGFYTTIPTGDALAYVSFPVCNQTNQKNFIDIHELYFYW